MKAVRVRLQCSLASFRQPVAARYQAAHWLPPRTTLVGFVAAAFGVAYEDMGPWYGRLLVGAVLENGPGRASSTPPLGFGHDLWQYTKLKASKPAEASVAVREILARPVYRIYVAWQDGREPEDIVRALRSPVYALRLGRSDDLALPLESPCLVTLEKPTTVPALTWTLLPYSWVDGKARLGSPPESRQRLRPPRVTRMTVAFEFSDARRPRVREPKLAEWTEVFDWPVIPANVNDLWRDGEWHFYMT